MAIQTEPTRIQIPFADSGTKNVIPDTNSTPSASQAASWTDGFPAQCSLPLSAGGIPPARADFNGILNTMTQSIRFGQEGGVWEWDATVDYGTNRVVLGSDGLLYWSIAQSGPNAGGAQDPTLDTSHTYWNQLPTDDAALVHKAGEEIITGTKKFTPQGPVILSPSLERGIIPSAETYLTMIFEGKDGLGDIQHRFGGIQIIHHTDGSTTIAVEVYKNEAGSTQNSWLSATIDQNSDAWASAPSTLDTRNEGSDILTRDWIPKDTRIVHTTGNENIDGAKTFTSNVQIEKEYPQLLLNNTAISGAYSDIRIASSGSNTTVIRDSQSGNLQLSHAYQSEGALTGAQLDLNYNGNFNLSACAGSGGTRRYLNGATDGTLKWNGQVVQTSSDERLKTPLAEVPDEVLDAWEAVDWGQFRFLDAVERKGEAARLHLGLIAQRVKAVFEDRGLDACDYGILCHDEREAVDEEWVEIDQEAYTDEDGVEHPAVTHVEHRHEDAVDIWMVRYAEALSMEACCQRRRADRAEARIADLEERLAAIEAKLNA